MINQIETYSKVNVSFYFMKMFWLLSTYKFIIIQIKYRNFEVFVYDSAEKQTLNTISLVIEKRKNEFDRIAKSPVFPHLFVCLERVISLSEHLPGSIFSREGDIASSQNFLISFKPIIYKLNYSHVIITLHYLWNLSWLLVKLQTLRRTHINISLTMKSNLNSGKKLNVTENTH